MPEKRAPWSPPSFRRRRNERERRLEGASQVRGVERALADEYGVDVGEPDDAEAATPDAPSENDEFFDAEDDDDFDDEDEDDDGDQ